jgi:hypothetical protein
VEISLSFFRTVDNSVARAKHARMRRAWVAAVLAIGAVLVRLLAPDYPLPYIRSFTVHRSKFFTSGDVLIGLVPLNIVLFWFLMAAAVVVALTALRRRMRS